MFIMMGRVSLSHVGAVGLYLYYWFYGYLGFVIVYFEVQAGGRRPPIPVSGLAVVRPLPGAPCSGFGVVVFSRFRHVRSICCRSRRLYIYHS